jgi:TolB-like protein/Flp pilus assembly protein TadD
MDPRSFFAELKRRNVYKVAAAYAVVGWLLIQIATQVFPFFDIPNWAVRLVILFVAIGFPIALVLAWAYELTPEGVKRVDEVVRPESITRATGRKLDFLIIGILLVIIGIFAWGHFGKHAPTVEPVSSKSIAVLPLENLSEEKENAFFADGIQDDLLMSLAKISDLKVISRTSVMQYRGAGAAHNLREIAQALGVENILEGSVRRVGNRVLVTVQLIDARHDRHIWAERYDRTIADSIGLQGELATEIAAALRAKLAPEEKASLEVKPTSNPDAYILYLRAREREQVVDATVEDRSAAEQLYAQAIGLDPGFALAYARRSINNSYLFLQSQDQTQKLKARGEAEEALRLAPALGEAHLALGFCFYLAEKDYAAALKEFSIVTASSPNNTEVRGHAGAIYRRQGRWREALATLERARDLDPRNPAAARILANTRVMVRDWPAATADAHRVLEIAPESRGPVINLAYLEVYRNGDPTAAKAILSRIPLSPKADGTILGNIWSLSMLQRDFAAALKILDEFPSDQLYPGNALEQKASYQGYIALARGDAALAQRLFEKVKPIFEAEVRDHPDDARRHAYLGWLYACMGRKEDAIREARRGVELEPESRDAYHGALTASNLALVYARTGEPEQAIPLIERLLSAPGTPEFGSLASMTQAELRLGWQWDPLRSNPRFKKIIEGPEPKTSY